MNEFIDKSVSFIIVLGYLILPLPLLHPPSVGFNNTNSDATSFLCLKRWRIGFALLILILLDGFLSLPYSSSFVTCWFQWTPSSLLNILVYASSSDSTLSLLYSKTDVTDLFLFSYNCPSWICMRLSSKVDSRNSKKTHFGLHLHETVCSIRSSLLSRCK